MAEGRHSGLWPIFVDAILRYRLVAFILVGIGIVGGLVVTPFEVPESPLPRDPVPVDAIPDIGENQQIVVTAWSGRSPRDVEDQITYPLTTALLGLPGVRVIRSSSSLGLSTIYVIFEDEVEFYWSRSRILEKLASLPAGTLPTDVQPALGPDATALGQVFWYTLEGRSPTGEVVGGWDPDELRSIQDWTVRYALQGVEGVSEVASIGGFVREYQVDVDPEAMRAHGVGLGQVADAVRRSNLDVGARTLEINSVEYLVRGLGFVEDLEDLEQTVVLAREHTPVRVRDLARVSLGPALRRGALDDAGAPAVGGVVVSRFQENPRQVIERVKQRLAEIQPGLPRRTLEDGTVSQVTVVPFYNRATLIDETLATLWSSLLQQILIAVLVVGLMLRSLRGSMLVSMVLPVGVLGTFGLMKYSGVDANIMALGGIAIAIGTMVDMAIVFVENIEQHLAHTEDRLAATRAATAEVAPAVLTAVATTLVSFLPVFGLTSTEYRLFAPLAFTKTFAMAAALALCVMVLPGLALGWLRPRAQGWTRGDLVPLGVMTVVVALLLAMDWQPLGQGRSVALNLLFVAVVLAVVLGVFALFARFYETLLAAVLRHRRLFLVVPLASIGLGGLAWRSLDRAYLSPFDEGAFLYMPTTMPHASFGEALRMLSTMDAAIAQVPEVDRVVGKIGRVDSALDPAPVSMIETVVTYHPEFRVEDGVVVRQWRDHIRGPEDVWDAIAEAAQQPGLTGAPVLMPIHARLVMLQSGMRAPLGVKIKGPSLESIETFGLDLQDVLRGVPAIRAETVFADRVVGKPYLEIDLDREAIGRYGLTVVDVQRVLQVALGGLALTRTVEGRARYPVRVRYMREDRDSMEALERVFVPTPGGEQIPLGQIAQIRYERGPQMIKSEDTFLTSYVLFDRDPTVTEVEVVEQARAAIADHLDNQTLVLPEGVSFNFAGSYEHQLRSEARLRLLVPLALALVFILLYLQFGRVEVTAIIYSGVLVSVSGGFMLLWLYGQPWFLDVPVLGASLRDLFGVTPIHLTVAVWVGMIALVGIATDDGVVMATYLRQVFSRSLPVDVAEVRARTLEAGTRRLRPCLMTTATTTLALLPVVTSQGRGADLMVPLAVPILGGMAIELMTLFVVPVLYCAMEERALARRQRLQA